MERSPRHKGLQAEPAQFWAAGIFLFLLGLSLRLFQLGLNGFWFDEIGVANVIHAENLFEVLRISKSHVMAMPLDYVLAYLMSHFGQTEFILRLPAALWGSLSILVFYIFIYRISGKGLIAGLSAFLLVISPIHVQYSQELRFYAALIFFYLFNFDRLKLALTYPSTQLWMIYFFSLLIGCFFHLYVVLVVIPGFIWLILKAIRKQRIFQEAAYFMMTNGIVLVILIFAAAILTSNQHAGTTYANFWTTIFQILSTGLGFIPPVGQYAGYVNGILLGGMLIFFLIGLQQLLCSEQIWNQSIALTVMITPLILLGLVLYKHYFIVSRQFIFLIPLVSYTLASGFLWIMSKLSTLVEKLGKFITVIIWVLGAALLIGINLQGLWWYYQTPKTLVREITSALVEQASPDSTVYVYPDWDVGSILFYYDRFTGEKFPGKLIGIAEIGVERFDRELGSYLITNVQMDAALVDQLKDQGYRSVGVKHPQALRSDVLWILHK